MVRRCVALAIFFTLSIKPFSIGILD